MLTRGQVARLIVAALVVAGIVTTFVLRRRSEPASPPPPQNLVLVTVDTLRADRVGGSIAPAVDRLASAGLQFRNARATVPLTLPSHVSIMTGTLPTVHGVRDNGVVFDGRVAPLARVLRESGRRTAAFVGAYVLDRRFGLADGFEVYDDRVRRDPSADARLEAERPAVEVIDAATTWLGQVSSPFFLWVHLYDPHVPYEPPLAFGRGRHPYDGEVAYADSQIARLLDALTSAGHMASTIVAVAGDHGEGLGEHGEHTHGMLAYDSTLKVPLVIAGAGITPGVVEAPVSLTDLAPSLLRRLGLAERIPETASGRDLFASLPEDQDVYSETQYPRTAGWHPLAVLAGERWKLIVSSEAELYDLIADPQEAQNVAPERAAIVQAMKGRLQSIQAASAADEAKGVPADAAERLRALGYVSGSTVSAPTADAPNPARVIDAWATFEDALARVNVGQAKEAVPRLEALARRFPEAPVFQSTLARSLHDSGRPSEAVAVYRAAVARWPDNPNLFHDLAVAARAAGDAAEAIRAEQAALALDADNPAALNGLGLLHADAGRSREAADTFELATRADPTNANYWANLGNARRELADAAVAEAAYRRALEIDPAHADAANGLGVLFVQSGRPAEAIAWFHRALERMPDFFEARLNLGIAYQESGQREQAMAVYRGLIAKAPQREREAAARLLKQLQ